MVNGRWFGRMSSALTMHFYIIVIVAGKSSAQLPSAATKITGKADVGYVKDSKKPLAHQKIKAITASVPTVGSTDRMENAQRKAGLANDEMVREHHHQKLCSMVMDQS